MRLFIGIELPSNVRSAVAAVSETCRRSIHRAAPRATLRWVQPDNLHITLWFLGEVAEERASGLTTVLERPFRLSAFRVALQGLGTYPPGGSPRVVWMGVTDGREALVQLYDELSGRLPALGFEPERRAYSPHLTLARVKDVPRADGVRVRAALGRFSRLVGDFEVSSVTLFRSRLSPKGSQYERLLRVPLG